MCSASSAPRPAGGEINRLVTDYLPFIKKEAAGFGASPLEYEDRLSLGMLVFMNCVKQYSEQRGAFFPYTSVCIRHRLIDEARKLGRAQCNAIPFASEKDDGAATPEGRASMAAYDRQQERRGLQDELTKLGSKLAQHGLSYGELARICPKQKRSRALCADLARRVLREPEMRDHFARRAQLPQKELARKAGVSEKTIEKHRRYIVALLLILQGDYPGIGAYIPGYGEVE